MSIDCESVHSFLGPDLLWRNVQVPCPDERRGALFIDRDGVLIEEKVYLSKPADVKLISGAVELLRAASAKYIPVVVVTNQAGIAKGKLDWSDFFAVEQQIKTLLAETDISLSGVFACPFHEEGVGVFRVANHPWRKPNPGMLIEASRLLNLDPGRSLLVGDKWSDIEAARNAELPRAIQVLTGHGPENATASANCASLSFSVVLGDDAAAAIPYLI